MPRIPGNKAIRQHISCGILTQDMLSMFIRYYKHSLTYAIITVRQD